MNKFLYTIKKNQELVTKISAIPLSDNDRNVSLDVSNLFTNIPSTKVL